MILKASQRAGAKQLAVHLMRDDDNDHVEVHQIRGFASENIQGALREAYAISQGTKCRQFSGGGAKSGRAAPQATRSELTSPPMVG